MIIPSGIVFDKYETVIRFFFFSHQTGCVNDPNDQNTVSTVIYACNNEVINPIFIQRENRINMLQYENENTITAELVITCNYTNYT